MKYKYVLCGILYIVLLSTADYTPSDISTCFINEDCQIFGDSRASCKIQGERSWCSCSENFDFYVSSNGLQSIKTCYPRMDTTNFDTLKPLSLVMSLYTNNIRCEGIGDVTASYWSFSKSQLSPQIKSIRHSCISGGIYSSMVLNVTLKGIFNTSLLLFPTAVSDAINSNEIPPLAGGMVGYTRLSFLRSSSLWCPSTANARFREVLKSGPLMMCTDIICSPGFGFNSIGACTQGIQDASTLRICNVNDNCRRHGDRKATCLRSDQSATCRCTTGSIYKNYVGTTVSQTASSTFSSCFNTEEGQIVNGVCQCCLLIECVITKSLNIITITGLTEQVYILSLVFLDVICDVTDGTAAAFKAEFLALVGNLFSEVRIFQFCETVSGTTTRYVLFSYCFYIGFRTDIPGGLMQHVCSNLVPSHDCCNSLIEYFLYNI